MLDGGQRADAFVSGRERPAAVECPGLRGLATRVVAQAIERDRVEPGLLARLAPIEEAPASQCALERVGDEILRKRAVPAAIGEEAEKALSVLLVKALELLVAHRVRLERSSSDLLMPGGL